MRNLEKVTRNWRLFYKLTADFCVTADDIEARYLIASVVRGDNSESSVYFLTDLDTNANLALKVFKDRRNLKEDVVMEDIFTREPSAVVKVHRIYWQPSLPRYRFILMERGIPLKNFITTLQKTNEGRINPLLKRLICAMATATWAVHRAGYHHRDLRLENFVIVREGDRDVPKLIDFGLALPVTFTDHSVNNVVHIRPPEFVYLHRTTPAEQVIYKNHHDIYALSLTFMELLDLRPNFYFPRNAELELRKLYKAEYYACRLDQVYDVLKLEPWPQAIRLIFYAGLPPKTYRPFHSCPMGKYLVQKYREFEQLDYLHSEALAGLLSQEPVFLAMLKHTLCWEPQDRVDDCGQLFGLYLDRLGNI